MRNLSDSGWERRTKARRNELHRSVGKRERVLKPPLVRRTRIHGEFGICRTWRDGRRNGEPAAREGPQRYGLQPHAFQSGVAGQERNEMGGLAARRGGSGGGRGFPGYEFRGARGGDEWARRHGGRGEGGEDF